MIGQVPRDALDFDKALQVKNALLRHFPNFKGHAHLLHAYFYLYRDQAKYDYVKLKLTF